MNSMERRSAVRAADELTGIDYLIVEPDGDKRPILYIHFLGEPPHDFFVHADQVSIESVRSDATPSSISAMPGELEDGVLRIDVAQVGEMTPYILRIDHEKMDRCFREIEFSFQAICERDLDCRTPARDDGEREWVDFPVDYMARDFHSFRRVLLEYASRRYPRWGDAVEADVAVMLIEAMSALGDEFSYYQDRIAGEAFLETASQRRSIRRLARLVDYWPREGRAATGWVTAQIADNVEWVVGGTGFSTTGPQPLHVEVGESFQDILSQREFPVLALHDKLTPYRWCDDDEILSAGTTEIYVEGDFDEDLEDSQHGELRMLLSEAPRDAGETTRNWAVEITDYDVIEDRLREVTTTRLRWSSQKALPFDFDLDRTTVFVNVLPVIAGRTEVRHFVIGESPDPTRLPQAVERLGPDQTVTYRFPVPGSQNTPLAWDERVPHVSLRSIFVPEISEVAPEDLDEMIKERFDQEEEQGIQRWNWRPSFVSEGSSTARDPDFVLEAGCWRRVKGHLENGIEYPHVDYAEADGVTLRFGDGQLGRIPARGTVFEVTYRLGNGAGFNLAAHTIREVTQPTLESANLVQSVTNPLPLEGGLDAENVERVRSDAPRAFRAITHRAVRPEDYAEGAQRLDWVHRAGASFRWTGSWATAFITPDSRGEAHLQPAHRRELETHLDRMRQVGRPLRVLEPAYVNIDLRISICVRPRSERTKVHRALLESLHKSPGDRDEGGIFHPDRFSFGTPLDRSEVEAFLQRQPGVKAVESVEIRRQGWFDWKEFDELRYDIADGEVIRILNDPAYPNRGTVQLMTHGGIG